MRRTLIRPPLLDMTSLCMTVEKVPAKKELGIFLLRRPAPTTYCYYTVKHGPPARNLRRARGSVCRLSGQVQR